MNPGSLNPEHVLTLTEKTGMCVCACACTRMSGAHHSIYYHCQSHRGIMPKTPSSEARCHCILAQVRTSSSHKIEEIEFGVSVSNLWGFVCSVGKYSCSLTQFRQCQGYTVSSTPSLVPSPEAARFSCILPGSVHTHIHVWVLGGGVCGQPSHRTQC